MLLFYLVKDDEPFHSGIATRSLIKAMAGVAELTKRKD
jgi:hypothetical protein